MALPDSFLQELISRNSIQDVVASYVRIKQRGRNSVGLCPFHGEKTPSFTVYPETDSFYCFGCGAGGDVITFIKKIENLDYIDAVRFLADRAGMKMPEDNVNDAVSRLRLRVLELNREAARFFHQTLYAPEGKVGLDYYYARGYNDQTIRRFGLGYAPQSFDTLLRAMRKKGFTDEELLSAFLAARSSKNRANVYDIFRGRIMIPIIDIRGNVIAFGGRVLDDSKPKYINTSDTVVYKKTNNLFALNIAKSSKAGKLILCEGYMDVIAMHQAGFDNAVAALGTSFTEEHASLVARYANEAILIFDADAAGQKGTQRAISLLRKTGVHIRVVTIPNGKDPDEFIKLYGPERFKLLIERSANDIEYQLSDLKQQYALETPDGRVSYLQEACALLARLNNPIERDVYAGKLSSELAVGKDAILAQIEHNAKATRRRQEKQQLSEAVRFNEDQVRRVNPDAQKYLRASRAEEGLIGLLLLHPDFFKTVTQRLAPESMVTAFNRGLYARLCERYKQGLLLDLVFLTSDYEDAAMAYISRMVQRAREGPQTPEQAAEYVNVILSEYNMLALNDVTQLPDDKIKEMLEVMRQQKK